MGPGTPSAWLEYWRLGVHHLSVIRSLHLQVTVFDSEAGTYHIGGFAEPGVSLNLIQSQ